MASLLHEIWDDWGEGNMYLPGVCFAGPDGNDFRKILSDKAKLAHAFWASCHVDAMNYYHGWAKRTYAYTTEYLQDYDSYPEEWAENQRKAGISR